jgi:hypothetical protein
MSLEMPSTIRQALCKAGVNENVAHSGSVERGVQASAQRWVQASDMAHLLK